MGKFIVFEGLDRSGKTTQCAMLRNYLSSKGNVESINYPLRDTNIGKQITKCLNKEISLNPVILHMLFSANRWESKEHLENLIKNNDFVICDRYSYSGIAYSSVVLDVNLCKKTEIGLPTPDLVIFLDCEVEKLTTRDLFGKELFEKVSYLTKVRNNYLTIKSEDKNIDWFTVQADDTKESIHSQIINYINKIYGVV
nr:MAG: thymidylate kinase [Diabrotica toursvirus 3a]